MLFAEWTGDRDNGANYQQAKTGDKSIKSGAQMLIEKCPYKGRRKTYVFHPSAFIVSVSMPTSYKGVT
jgi:hypothetical protein